MTRCHVRMRTAAFADSFNKGVCSAHAGCIQHRQILLKLGMFTNKALLFLHSS